MSTATRRLITRICLAIDVLLLIAVVIGVSVSASPDWAAGFYGITFAVIGIVMGLFYLHHSRGRS